MRQLLVLVVTAVLGALGTGCSSDRPAGPTPAGAVAIPSSGPVLAKFTATWCKHCRELDARIDTMVVDGVRVVDVDIEAHPQLAERHGVNTVPTLAVFVDGTLLGKVTGLRSAADLMPMVERLERRDYVGALRALDVLATAANEGACGPNGEVAAAGDGAATCDPS